MRISIKLIKYREQNFLSAQFANGITEVESAIHILDEQMKHSTDTVHNSSKAVE